MIDRIKILSALAAVAIVGGALYALDRHFPADLLVRPDHPQGRAVPPKPQTTPHGLNANVQAGDTASRAGHMERPMERPVGSATQSIYRCTQNGKTTYTETPCPGGIAINLQASRGVDTRQDMRRSQSAVNSLQQAARSQEPAVQTRNGVQDAADSHHLLRCNYLEDRIQWIDSASRQQNTLQMLEYYKNERKQARDEQFRLRC